MKTDFITDAEDHITEEAITESSTNAIPPGAVLVVTRSGILERTLPVATTKVRVALNQDLKALSPREGINARYVALALKRYEREILRSCSKSGTTVANIEFPAFQRFEVPLAPTMEQSRIVEEVEQQFTRLDAGVAALQRAQAQLKRYRASVLKAACEGRLVPTEAEVARRAKRDYEPAEELLNRILQDRRSRWEAEQLKKMIAAGKVPKDDRWKTKYEEPVGPSRDILPLLPEGWVWCALDQLVWSLEGGNAATATSTRTDRAILRSSSVRQGNVDFDDHRFLPATAAFSADPLIAEGDLLFTRLSGTLEYVGNCAVVRGLGERRLEFPDRIFRGRMVSPECANYVESCFGERTLRRSLERAAKSTAGHQRISLSDLRAFAIPLPPTAEQLRIHAEARRLLSVADAVQAALIKSATRTERLREAVLRSAFDGSLVAQNPKDEPATALVTQTCAAQDTKSRRADHRSTWKREQSKKART